MKTQLIVLGMACAYALTVSCEKTKPETICCKENTEHTVGETGETITVHSVFTPDNLPFYDEVIEGIPYQITDDGQLTDEGRPNVYENLNDEENDYFFIEGIEQFPYNEIYFYTVNDTTPLMKFPYIDYKNKNGVVFDGRMNECQLDGADIIVRPKYLQSGEYRYKILIFEDKKHEKKLDELTGNFYIVRPQYPSTKDCEN